MKLPRMISIARTATEHCSLGSVLLGFEPHRIGEDAGCDDASQVLPPTAQLAETQLYREVYAMIEMWRRDPLHSPRHLVLPSDWCIYCRQHAFLDASTFAQVIHPQDTMCVTRMSPALTAAISCSGRSGLPVWRPHK